MKLRHKVALGAGALVLVGILCGVQTEETVSLHGKLIADRNAMLVHAPFAATVVQLLAGVGEHVRAGQPLLALDPNLGPDSLAEADRRMARRDQDQKTLNKTLDTVAALLAAPDKLRITSLTTLGVTGETFNLINDLYTARLEFDAAREFRRLNVTHQKNQLASEIALAQRNIELLRRNLESAKKAADGRTTALEGKHRDFTNLMKLAEKGLVPATDVSRERDAMLTAEVSEADSRKQLDQIELDISNRNLHISELRMQMENAEEEANTRQKSASLRYDLRLAKLAEHKTYLEHALQEAASGTTTRAQDTNAHLVRVTAPTTGTLQKFGTNGVGERVDGGALLASVLPDGQGPLALLDVRPMDALRLCRGQKVRITLDAYPANRFGTLDGEVERVFPREDGDRFAVRVRLMQHVLRVRNVDVPLLPNFSVHAQVVLGKRRALTALFGR